MFRLPRPAPTLAVLFVVLSIVGLLPGGSAVLAAGGPDAPAQDVARRPDSPAADPRSPDLSSDISSDFREVVRSARARVFPAVVYIRAIRQGMESGRARGEEVGGSGVVVSADGEVLTNWHVIDRVDQVRCLLSDGRHFKAKVLASDADLDLALLKLELPADGAPLPVAELGRSGVLEEGDFVMAMGAPWGLNRSVSVGIISCTRRFLPENSEYSLWLQTDASISPGNSGGPLVDTHGRIVGINTLGQSSGGDLGFAVPADTIREVLDRMRERHEVGWSWLGLRLQPLRDFDRDMWFEGNEGVIVASVDPGSPAEAAGVRSRDRLLSLDGGPCNGLTAEDLPAIRRRLALLPPEVPATLDLLRGSERLSVQVTPVVKGKVQGEELECQRWGLTAKTINRFENPELHRQRAEGVFIFGVRSPGNAANAGLQPNDIIVEVEGKPIATLAELEAAHAQSVANLGHKKRVLVKLLRSGQVRQSVLDISRDYERE